MGCACCVVDGGGETVVIYTTPGAQERPAELTLGSMMVPVIVEEDGSVHVAAGGG